MSEDSDKQFSEREQLSKRAVLNQLTKDRERQRENSEEDVREDEKGSNISLSLYTSTHERSQTSPSKGRYLASVARVHPTEPRSSRRCHNSPFYGLLSITDPNTVNNCISVKLSIFFMYATSLSFLLITCSMFFRAFHAVLCLSQI